MARLSELKVEMGDRVQQLERVKSDQTDVIGRFDDVQFLNYT